MSEGVPAPVLRWLGLVDYEPTWRAMQRQVESRGTGSPDEFWFLEHPPVFTMGMNARSEHLLAPSDITVVHIGRGGQVPYHGPGQLVVYPLIDLERARLGVRARDEGIERAIIGILFEDIIRENLDLGRPDQVQLIFARRVTKRTPGRFRTRIITQGVTPSLHIDYKSSRIKQYHKAGRALRTETTINNPRDFAIGKLLANLPALRQVGFAANRRLPDVQMLSHDCALGEAAFQQLNQPRTVNQQRVAALRFADPPYRRCSASW